MALRRHHREPALDDADFERYCASFSGSSAKEIPWSSFCSRVLLEDYPARPSAFAGQPSARAGGGGEAHSEAAGDAGAAGEQDGKASEGGEEGSTAVGSSLGGLQVFEFNGKTAPVQRHKRIKDFQGGGDDGAKVSGCRSNRGPICGART